MLNTSYQDFASAGKAVLEFLHQKYGFNLWMITRTNGNDWIVLQSNDHGYDVTDGMVFEWTDSFCSQMVQGKGPKIAPNAKIVPAYDNAPIGKKIPISAYIGFPILDKDNQLFGTLCAIDPNIQSDELAKEEDLIALINNLLSTVLSLEIDVHDKIRRDQRELANHQIDALTQLYNWRAWERLLDGEEARCQTFGHIGDVIAIDLKGLKAYNTTYGREAGDLLLNKTAQVIKSVIKEDDVIARVGNDEFALYSLNNGLIDTETLANNVINALKEQAIEAYVGYARSTPKKGLRGAWEMAEHMVYKEKQLQRIAG